MVTIYRKTYGLFACNGIMYNHESPRRGENFVTRKICRAAAAIKLGLEKELHLGDTTSQRDWGHARDYVRGMWLALQQETAEDFVFATGQLHTVQDVVETAFGVVRLNWKDYVKQDPRFMRPAEPMRLLGNAAKARQLLKWEPQTTFTDLITEMTKSEMALLSTRGEEPK
jgi:GDPmannose 4,6-dehydratase